MNRATYLFAFDILRYHQHLFHARQMADRRHNLIIQAVVDDIANKAAVNLENIRVHAFQPRIARIAGAKIINCNTYPHFLQLPEDV